MLATTNIGFQHQTLTKQLNERKIESMSSKHFHTHIISLNTCQGLISLVIVLIGLLLVSGGTAGRASSLTQSNGVQDKGDFKVVYSPVKNPKYAELQKELQNEKVFEAIAADLNNTIALPVDITITFAECGQVNAFYDPNKRQISMCYELVDHFADSFSKVVESEDKLEEAVVGATIFVFFHEVGHSLVHILDLPITGKEEDAVDQLSTFVLTSESDEGEQAALNGAMSFYLASQKKETKVEDLAFWDEHSLSQQRFYNVLCWVFGQNEQKYDGLVKNGLLPVDRAQRCNGEYAQLAKSWNALLAPHLK